MFQSIAFYIGAKTPDLNGQGYLEHPEGYGGDDFFGPQLWDGYHEIRSPRPPFPPKPPEKARALLIWPGA